MNKGEAVKIYDMYHIGNHPRSHSGTVENKSLGRTLVRLDVPFIENGRVINQVWFRDDQLKAKEQAEVSLTPPTNYDAMFATLEYLVLISNVTNAAFMQEGKAKDYYDDCCIDAVDLPNADVHLVKFNQQTMKSTTIARFGVFQDLIWK